MSDRGEADEARLVRALQEGLTALWREESAQHKKRLGSYYPSEVGGCLRKQYYSYTVGEKPSPEKLAVFATGRGVHASVAQALRKSGIVTVDAEEYPISLRISDEVELSGRVDVLLLQMDGRKVVLEVKSTSRIPERPHDDHLLQLQTYLHAMGLERGFLLYWDKRTGALNVFSSDRDEAYLRRLGERAIILHEHLKKGRPPLKEAFLQGRYWECDLCDYRGTCMPFVLEGIEPGSSICVFDLDGVVFDDGLKVKSILGKMGLPEGVRPEDLSAELWERFAAEYFSEQSFAMDRPSPPVLDMIKRKKREGLRVVLLSERSQASREATLRELTQHGVQFDALLLRPEDLSTYFWKRDMLKRLKENYVVEFFMDDSERVRAAAAKLGVNVLSSPSSAG